MPKHLGQPTRGRSKVNDCRSLIVPVIEGTDQTRFAIFTSGGSDHKVKYWDMNKPHNAQELTTAHRDSILGMAYFSQTLVTAGRDGLVKVWQ